MTLLRSRHRLVGKLLVVGIGRFSDSFCMVNFSLRTVLPGLLAVVISAPWAVTAFAEKQQVANVVASDSSKNTIRFGRRRGEVSAPLVDHGDFYFHPNGRKIKFFRKKNVYVVKTDRYRREHAMRRVKQQFGNRIEPVRAHHLGGLSLVRVVENRLSNRRVKPDLKITPAMLKSADQSITGVQSVFANQRGRGDIVLLPKLTLKLSSGVAEKAAIKTLARRYGLQLERRLKLSGYVYSFALKNKRLSESGQFALVRSLMSDSLVAWAEPQFISQPYKNQFEPISNPLYSQQWHLRNTGIGGSRCDTDCDANDAWDIDTDNVGGGDQGLGAVAGAGMVIAIIDDGVQLDHEDLDIWTNGGEIPGNNIDDDANGYIDDVNGWDFVDDPNTSLQNADEQGVGTCMTGDDGTPGPDNDPSPQATSDCLTTEGDDVEQDNHGTAVAGLAAAIGYNTVGVAGTAFRAKILPIRAISAFDNAAAGSFCLTIAEAMEYAGRYADVINNSWGMNETCVALETAISNVAAGTVMDGMVNVSKRKSTDPGSGSPVLFASGNNASGWIKVTVPVSAGEHAYEWRFLRSAFPDLFQPDPSGPAFAEEDSAWIDEITWPDGSVEGFEGDLSDFNNDIVLNSCNAECTSFLLPARPTWSTETQLDHVLSGLQSAKIDASNSDCGNSYLHTLREDIAGEISFWLWVSTNTENVSDKFEFLIDGVEVISFGDLPGFVDNAVGYPANLDDAIAVGASTSGDLSGLTAASTSAEIRSAYSQYGPTLDLLASAGHQHLGITTTDRSGNNEGYNIGSGADYADTGYTRTFGGTSASTPLVAGVAAAIIAIDGDLDATQVRNLLLQSADKIGTDAYDAGGLGRNDFYGHGRLNMLNALQLAAGIGLTDPLGDCSSPEVFSYRTATDLILSSYTPLAPFCPAKGAIPAVDEFCVPIKASNGNVVLVCL